MNLRAQYQIGKNEFIRIISNPLIVVVISITIILLFLNGAGNIKDFRNLDTVPGEDAFMHGFRGSWYYTSMICMIMAAFLGATSITNERWNSSLSLLLTKPLYRKDYLLGKSLGLSVFMLLFITIILLLTSLFVTIYFRAPLSISDFTWRLITYIVILTLCCSIVATLNMLFGIITKNILVVTSISMTYLFIEWFWNLRTLTGLTGIEALYYISPVNTYLQIFLPTKFFYTTISFETWLAVAAPYLCILFIDLFVLLSICIYLFSKGEND